MINRGLGTRFINGGGPTQILYCKMGSGSWGLINREGLINTNLTLSMTLMVLHCLSTTTFVTFLSVWFLLRDCYCKTIVLFLVKVT